MAALAPAVSRALAAIRSQATVQVAAVELCTALPDHHTGRHAAAGHAGHAGSADAVGDAGSSGPAELAAAGIASADRAGAPATSQHDASHLDHCGYCFLDHHAPVLPDVPAVLPLPLTARNLVPPLLLQAPYLLAAWRSAQPRGPPRYLS
jgi:hypothetical protein